MIKQKYYYCVYVPESNKHIKCTVPIPALNKFEALGKFQIALKAPLYSIVCVHECTISKLTGSIRKDLDYERGLRND